MSNFASPGPRRRYSSVLRAERAAETRRRVIAAATDLFTELGFAGTTIDRVAARAGVGRKTVFDAVGGKAELLRRAYDVAIVGDDEPVPLVEREAVRALIAEPDASRRLMAYAELVTDIDRRIVGVYRALDAGAAIDPEAAALHDRLVQQRRTSMEPQARRMHDDGALLPGMTPEEAADLLWLYTDPLVYDKLVCRQGWTDGQFSRWLGRTLCAQLVGA
ncbi:MAG TPA: TetR/AcrR family transcriptional regulator [Microlunatus sp.]|nr:TetR/AcrR family transcriptional regulator [Microlunatus sp.]